MKIHRLPNKYRAPFVLCFLEGKTRVEAARELCGQEGTVSSRLARARQRLQARLARRGITLSAALGAAALSQAATAAMPVGLAVATVHGALEFGVNGAAILSTQASLGATGALVGGKGLSESAVLLAEAMMKTAILSRALLGVIILVGVLACGSAACLIADWAPAAAQGEPVAQASKAPQADKAQDPSPSGETPPPGGRRAFATRRGLAWRLAFLALLHPRRQRPGRRFLGWIRQRVGSGDEATSQRMGRPHHSGPHSSHLS
jgi:hypothetical protein